MSPAIAKYLGKSDLSYMDILIHFTTGHFEMKNTKEMYDMPLKCHLKM